MMVPEEAQCARPPECKPYRGSRKPDPYHIVVHPWYALGAAKYNRGRPYPRERTRMVQDMVRVRQSFALWDCGASRSGVA